MPQNREPNPQQDAANTHPPPDARDDYEVDGDDVAGPDDLERNPGIGASKGTTMAGADADDLDDDMADAENTFEGDVENDAGRPGAGVDPNRRGRKNQ